MNRPEEHDILEAFGRKVREFRQNVGLSQEELAAKAGVHRTYIGMIERGEKNATIISMHRISKALGTDLVSLISGVSDGK